MARHAPVSGPFVVIEDDPVVLDFIACSLEDAGREVIKARSLEEARAFLGTRPKDARRLCLIIDVVLENESGIDFAQEELAQHPDSRVLLISGYTDDVVLCDSEHAARISFLGKPFTKRDLMAALGRLDG